MTIIRRRRVSPRPGGTSKCTLYIIMYTIHVPRHTYNIYTSRTEREARACYRHILREFLRSGLHIIIIIISICIYKHFRYLRRVSHDDVP